VNIHEQQTFERVWSFTMPMTEGFYTSILKSTHSKQSLAKKYYGKGISIEIAE
jgi:hypothetical protein